MSFHAPAPPSFLLLLAGVAAAHQLDETPLPAATAIFDPATNYLSTGPSNCGKAQGPRASTILAPSFGASLAALPPTATTSDLSTISREQALFCETSGAAPPMVWTHDAASWIIGTIVSGLVCLQRNLFGSKCTEHVRFETANRATCNDGEVGGAKYTTMEWAPKHIANMCPRRRVAGGTMSSGM